MDAEAVKAEFWVLCQDFTQSWAADTDTRDWEPFLLAILRFCQQNEASHTVLVACFEQILTGDKRVPLEAVEFCMHTLRWNEIYSLTARLIREATNPRVQSSLSHVLNSFDPEWEDRDLYPYYSIGE